MLVVLELQDQPAVIRRVTVRHDIVVGRGSDCNLRLSAPQISRRHCFLRIGRDSASIMDLDSRNGTFLDNVRVESGRSYSLTHGSMLALGPVRFRVEIRSDTGTDSDQPVLDESISGLGPRTYPAASTHAEDPGFNLAGVVRVDTAPQSIGVEGPDPDGLNESTAGMDEDARFSPASGESPLQQVDDDLRQFFRSLS